MTKQTEALMLAVEALEASTLETFSHDDYWDLVGKAIQACKKALEQPAQEPVAWMHRHAGEITEFNDFQSCQYCEPLYTHPAPLQKPYCYTVEQKNGLSQGSMCRTVAECKQSPLYDPDIDHIIPLYKNPAPSWQGLTAKEIASIPLNEDTVQTVERILKEKNT